MAPNALTKETVIRVVESEQNKKEYNDRTLIRTDFILQNVYSYLLKNPSGFKALSPANKHEEELIRDYESILDDLVLENGEKIRYLCNPLSIDIDQITTELTQIFHAVFANGYNWSATVSFFVFVAIYTQMFIENRISEDVVVDTMYESFCCLIKEKLKPWVDHHGGWGGVRYLKVNRKQVGWAQNLLRNTASFIGTITHFSTLP